MPEPVPQAAALATRGGLVCLITSSSGDRWILPKGHQEPGQSLPECAANEAYEEAGLVGTPAAEPFAWYDYERAGLAYRVAVFELSEFEELADWPEYFGRVREWVTPEQAILRVREPGLKALLAKWGGVGPGGGAP